MTTDPRLIDYFTASEAPHPERREFMAYKATQLTEESPDA